MIAYIQANMLKQPVIQVAKYCDTKKNALRVLSMLRFGKFGEDYSLAGTDLNAFAVYKLPFELSDPFLVDSRQLVKWVRKLHKNEMISLELKGGYLILHSRRFSVSFPAHDDEFPAVRQISADDTLCSFKVNDVAAFLKASTLDARRPVLMGATIKEDGSMFCADGFRLHFDKVQIEWHEPELRFPVARLDPHAFKAITTGEVEVFIERSLCNFAFRKGGLTVTGTVDTGGCIAIDSLLKATVNHAHFDPKPVSPLLFENIGILRDCPPLRMKAGSEVFARFDDGFDLDLSSVVEALIHCPAPVTSTLDARMLADALSFVGCDASVWQFDPVSPICLKSGERLALLMPMNINRERHPSEALLDWQTVLELGEAAKAADSGCSID